MIWTDDNTRDSPTSYDMDGKGSVLKEKDIVDMREKTIYFLDLLEPFTDGNMTVYLYKGVEHPEVILSENNLSSFFGKFSSAGPPPTVHGSIPFDYVGDPVYCPNGDYNATVHLLGWDNEVWATYREDGNVFAVRQFGTDRYYVDAAEGGASVPGAGENVFFNDKATEDGVWNATTHWKASTGVAVGDAYVCTMDVNSAALGTITMSYASATLAVVTYTLEHDGAGAISAGTVTVTTGKWQADGAITLSGGTFLSNTAHTLDVNANYTLSGATHNAPTAAGAFTCASTTFTQSSGTYNNDSGLVTMDGAGTTTLGSNAISFNSVTISNGTTLNTSAASNFALTNAGATSVSGTLTCNASTVSLAAVTVNDGGLYSNMTATSNISGNLAVGAGVSGSMTTAVGTIHIDGTTAIAAGATMGSAAVGYTLNMDGSLLASAGTLIAPNTATFTFSGATWNTPTTFTNSTSTVSFDLAGSTSLGNASILFNAITIANGTTLTCTASNYALTCAGDVTIGGGVSGTLSGTAAANSFKDVTLALGSTWNMTSGNTTITSETAGGYALNNVADGDINNNNGTLIITTAAATKLHVGTDIILYNLQLNHASLVLYLEQLAVVDSSLTITAGTFSTINESGSSSKTFTNNGTTSIFGTMTCGGSTIATNSVTIQVGGTLNGTTDTHTCSGAWNNLGTNTQNGTMLFTDAAHAISGNNTWKNLTITCATARIITFEAAKTQTIGSGGYCLLNGAVGQLLTLTSSTTTPWIFAVNALATYDFAYLSVSYSNATGRECEAAFSTAGTGNTNWSFGTAGVYIWDGGGTGNLASTAGNWEGGVAPGVTSSVQFSSASVKNVTWDIVSTTGNITIYSDYTGTLTFGTDAVFNNLDIQGGTVTCGAYTIRTLLAFSQSGGVFTAPAAGDQLTISGNFTHSAGTWTHNSGLTVFNGTAQAITGSTTWASFTKSVTSADTLTIAASSTQTYVGNVTLSGAAGQLLSLVSSTPGTRWNFVMTSPAVKTSLTCLSVTDSSATGSDAAYKPIAPTSSVDGGNTVDWFTGGAFPAMAVMRNGIFYTNPGLSVCYIISGEGEIAMTEANYNV